MNTLLLTLANMGVSLDDVADVVNNCIPQLIFFGVVVAAAIIVLIAMAVNKKLAKPTKFMVRAQSGLAVLLAFGIMLNLVAFGPMSTMLDLVTGNGTITEESGAEANALCTEIAEEGIVLLQNDDNELPLASGSNLNVFGWASVGPVYGGTGAGAISADRPTVSLLDGLHNAGINTNTELSDFYTAYCAERPALGYSNHNWTLPEPTAASYTQELIDNAKSFSDTAMVVISRVGGEMADLPTNMDGLNYTENSTEYNDFEPGQHYLSLTKTEKNMIDINNNFTGVSSIGFPSEIIIASTFNTDLARRYGESIGRMASEMNVTGWYAPAMNGHRSAFDGRNFEYYSEDSVLAGYIGASSIAGAQSYGVYAYMKHFALNDQQINQSKLLCTWADEQAIREIYLRPFEISAKVGGCKAVMSSWNYIGNQWAGACNALLNGVLRGEWGFRGMVITDGFHFTDYMDSDIAIRNGCDLMLKNYDVATNHLTDTTSATSVKAMRQACKNIMYTVVNSRVYDPANTVSTPIWRTAMIVVNVLLAVLLVVLEVLTFKSYKKKKAQ